MKIRFSTTSLSIRNIGLLTGLGLGLFQIVDGIIGHNIWNVIYGVGMIFFVFSQRYLR